MLDEIHNSNGGPRRSTSNMLIHLTGTLSSQVSFQPHPLFDPMCQADRGLHLSLHSPFYRHISRCRICISGPRRLTVPTEYLTCFTGTSQSPINLHSTQGLATTHAPSFAKYTAQTNTTGTFKNWGFGPAFDLDMVNDDPTTLPAMTFDDQTVYLSGWHIHFPSEHLVDGVRSRGKSALLSTSSCPLEAFEIASSP